MISRTFAARAAALLVLALTWVWPPMAMAARDFQDMAARIETLLSEAAGRYAAGDAETAKTNVQKAYFEVFENMEGPIRINISAKKSYELEAEFGDVRKRIMAGAPVDEVTARIKAQIAAIHAVVPVISSGHRLTAEPSADAPNAAPVPEAKSSTIEPHWVKVVDGIGKTIAEAAAVYEAGETDKAREMITRAQFDGYKNSLLETAVRRHVSQRQDIEYNAEFQRIAELVKSGRPARMVRASGEVLVADMRGNLPGLPLVGALAEQAAAKADLPTADWRQVADGVMAAMNEAVALYKGGDTGRAVGRIQDTYFDVFEASGMEAQIGARDAAFKTRLEGHFNRVMGRMQGGAEEADLKADLAAMTADFDTAVDTLGTGSDSPVALFLYALLIILREGFEAILIVTALIAYLVKTGNRDKLGVIYNSVIVALLASVVTAVLVKWVFQVSAASQEVLEGATMLVAAVVLFSMSYWVISKAEAEKWVAYLKETVGRSLSSGSLKALWFASFLAVFREGAETVLFYQALTIGADAPGLAAIVGGFVVGCVGLAVIYLLMRLGAMRLPIRPFFMVTGLLLYAMAFVFAGKGVMELVEGNVIEPTLIAWAPEIQFLGVFPYWQTLIPQIALVLAALVALAVLMKQRNSIAITRGK
ncbi:MAG: FTR1 family iron permease [Rhodospirillales bacterium]|nr:FTR1 family iron permease [Rhodospirillales bacterium]